MTASTLGVALWFVLGVVFVALLITEGPWKR